MADVRCTGFKTCLVHSQTDGNNADVACPDGMIQNCFFQFRDAGLNLTSVQQWQVSGCEFYMLGDGYNAGGDCMQENGTDVSVTDADTVAITGCRFNRTSSDYNAPNRINIVINPVVTPSNIEAQRFLIAHNQFGDQVIAATFGISAVKVRGTASDIQIGHNDYIGTYSGPVIDDQTGTGAVVATLGYPTTNTVGSAVVPIGNAAVGQPTLGTNANPWPATYNQLFYLPRQSAAPIPLSGWVFYTDSTGDLWAQWEKGAPIKVLSHP